MKRLNEIEWEKFEALSLEEKRPYLERVEGDGMPYHTLFAQQFDRPVLERLCALANRIRFINKTIRGKGAKTSLTNGLPQLFANLFARNLTRVKRSCP